MLLNFVNFLSFVVSHLFFAPFAVKCLHWLRLRLAAQDGRGGAAEVLAVIHGADAG
jgi:hypothetical protein